MHAYPHTSPLADTNCIILTVHQQLYMEKGDSPHFDHHHEVLENKKRSTMNVFQAIRGDQYQAYPCNCAQSGCKHAWPTNDSFWYAWHQGPPVSERHLRTTSQWQGSCIRVYFHNRLNCVALTRRKSIVIAVASVPAGSHWPIVSFGARVKRRPCKRCQNLANLRQKHNRQVPASWESGVLLFYLHTWNLLNSVRWRYKIWAYIRPSACSVGRGVMLSVMFMGVWMNSQMCAYF